MSSKMEFFLIRLSSLQSISQMLSTRLLTAHGIMIFVREINTSKQVITILQTQLINVIGNTQVNLLIQKMLCILLQTNTDSLISMILMLQKIITKLETLLKYIQMLNAWIKMTQIRFIFKLVQKASQSVLALHLALHLLNLQFKQQSHSIL